eukprot:CAMPEP_0194063824 /NCGR_PEP_ID=MMETSP0009_2-20130614/81345_1 /TAXON_ID=210454 /ORGANISM="Grammatophora oceanica, Strain CCMP 410" /LENGTH=67 /DNA_ID=CAMNT_0038716091 /DNA_START=18 /DNA_END=221 /DNA_ORIENTATION=-
MATPVRGSGPPCRPTSILIAHRWGREIYDTYKGDLEEKLECWTQLETREAALHAARMEGTDPNGYNF